MVAYQKASPVSTRPTASATLWQDTSSNAPEHLETEGSNGWLDKLLNSRRPALCAQGHRRQNANRGRLHGKRAMAELQSQGRRGAPGLRLRPSPLHTFELTRQARPRRSDHLWLREEQGRLQVAPASSPRRDVTETTTFFLFFHLVSVNGPTTAATRSSTTSTPLLVSTRRSQGRRV